MEQFESFLLLLQQYKEGYTRLDESELFSKMMVMVHNQHISYEEYQYLLGLMSQVNDVKYE